MSMLWRASSTLSGCETMKDDPSLSPGLQHLQESTMQHCEGGDSWHCPQLSPCPTTCQRCPIFPVPRIPGDPGSCVCAGGSGVWQPLNQYWLASSCSPPPNTGCFSATAWLQEAVCAGAPQQSKEQLLGTSTVPSPVSQGSLAPATPKQPCCSLPISIALALHPSPPLAWQSSDINVLYPNGQQLLREGITT